VSGVQVPAPLFFIGLKTGWNGRINIHFSCCATTESPYIVISDYLIRGMGKMRSRVFILMFLPLLFVSNCSEKITRETEQLGTVQGYVSYRYADSIMLLEGAIVSVDNLSDTTGIDGHFSIANILYGEKSIQCIHPKFDTLRTKINVDEPDIINDIRPDGRGFTVTGFVTHSVDGAVYNAEIKNRRHCRYNR
jgi:hypothetical protein